MRPRPPTGFLRVSLALALLLTAAPAAAQEEDNLATFDFVDGTSSKSDCDTVFCLYTVDATLRYYTPILPATIQCFISGNENTNGEVIHLDEPEGTLSTTLTTSTRSKIGEDDAVAFFGCVLEAEGIRLAVSRHQPHAEAAVEVEAEAAPEEAAPADDLADLLGEGFLDLLPGAGVEPVTFQETLDYARGRGNYCATLTPAGGETCFDELSLAARDILVHFAETIGVVENTVPSKSEGEMIQLMATAGGLAPQLGRDAQPVFPAVKSGLENLWMLAEQGASDPAAAQLAKNYFHLLTRMDVQRGQHLAQPGNN